MSVCMYACGVCVCMCVCTYVCVLSTDVKSLYNKQTWAVETDDESGGTTQLVGRHCEILWQLVGRVSVWSITGRLVS